MPWNLPKIAVTLLQTRICRTSATAFSIKLANKACGESWSVPEFATLFFKETDKALDMSKPYQFLKPILGNVAFVASHETYYESAAHVFYEPFQREKMARYLEIMDETVRRWVAIICPTKADLNSSDTINNLVQEVAGRAIVGDDFMEKAGKDFWANYNVVGKALDPIIPSNWPLPKFIRRDRARKRMAATLATHSRRAPCPSRPPSGFFAGLHQYPEGRRHRRLPTKNCWV
jgi:cytochrome P450